MAPMRAPPDPEGLGKSNRRREYVLVLSILHLDGGDCPAWSLALAARACAPGPKNEAPCETSTGRSYLGFESGDRSIQLIGESTREPTT